MNRVDRTLSRRLRHRHRQNTSRTRRTLGERWFHPQLEALEQRYLLTAVVGNFLVYGGSFFDTGPGTAIDTDKTPYIPNGTTAVFASLYWRPLPGAHYLIDLLAVMSSLYALYDLTDFLLVGARTDAVILAEITPVPAFIWALLWSAVSLTIVYLAGKRAITLR